MNYTSHRKAAGGLVVAIMAGASVFAWTASPATFGADYSQRAGQKDVSEGAEKVVADVVPSEDIPQEADVLQPEEFTTAQPDIDIEEPPVVETATVIDDTEIVAAAVTAGLPEVPSAWETAPHEARQLRKIVETGTIDAGVDPILAAMSRFGYVPASATEIEIVGTTGGKADFLSPTMLDVNGERLVLRGVAEPSDDATCTDSDATEYSCYKWSLASMQVLASEDVVTCFLTDAVSDGRTVASCTATIMGEQKDLAGAGVLSGALFTDTSTYAAKYVEESRIAQTMGLGLWSGSNERIN